MEKTKVIKITMSNDIYNRLKQTFHLKIACGSAYGEIDSFIAILFEAIDDNAKEITIMPREKEKWQKQIGK